MRDILEEAYKAISEPQVAKDKKLLTLNAKQLKSEAWLAKIKGDKAKYNRLMLRAKFMEIHGYDGADSGVLIKGGSISR